MTGKHSTGGREGIWPYFQRNQTLPFSSISPAGRTRIQKRQIQQTCSQQPVGGHRGQCWFTRPSASGCRNTLENPFALTRHAACCSTHLSTPCEQSSILLQKLGVFNYRVSSYTPLGDRPSDVTVSGPPSQIHLASKI